MDDERYELFDIYSKTSDAEREQFASTTESKVNLKSDYHKVEYDLSWLELMEDTLHYIDNILINPKRFIVNEEEIVKVEKAKKVTVESVIHLTQHTNLIEDMNMETGEVRPSKILNILKEETLDTYENRFIYTLILNMMNFVSRYGPDAMNGSSVRNVRSLSYEGKAKKGDENINISLNLNAANIASLDAKDSSGKTVAQRITRLQERITDFTTSDLYKDLARAHVAVVRSPIKKTNVILKNPNFQRAEALWNFMERYDKDSKREVKYNKNIVDNKELKANLDLSFIVEYALLNKFARNAVNEEEENDINLNMLNRSIKNYLDYDPEITENKFMALVKKAYNETKKEQKVKFNQIRKIISKNLDEYDKIKNKAFSLLK